MLRSLRSRSPALEPIEREAHGWVRRLTSGRATAADVDALDEWVARSDVHAHAYARAQALWDQIGMAGKYVSNRDPLPLRAPPPWKRVDVQRRAMLGGAVSVAAIAGAAMVYPPLHIWPSLNELRADYRTGTGEQRELELAENVRVAMNTQTQIAVRSQAGPASSIELINGEAAVDMSGADRSFVVISGKGKTLAAVAGTRFEVRRIGKETCVTCLAGDIRVEYAGRTLRLASDQQVIYNDAAMGLPASIDVELAAAWRAGVVVFRQTALADVVSEINRYRPGRVILLDDAKGRLPVNGRFSITDLDQALVQIQQVFGVRARSLGDLVILS